MSAKWYLGTGAQNDVVISTSIHLARNIKQFPFPASLSMQDKLKVNSVIKTAAEDIKDYSFNHYEMKTLSQAEVVSLAERHLVSPEFASSRDAKPHGLAVYHRCYQRCELCGIYDAGGFSTLLSSASRGCYSGFFCHDDGHLYACV